MAIVESELVQIKSQIKDIPNTELIACHPSMVQIKVSYTPYKQLVVCVQFPKEYPHCRALVELKSKTIPGKFIDGLIKVCDQELDKLIGSVQVIPLVKFICEFISSNPFIVCSDELSYIKKELYREGDEIKVKQKAGTIHYKAYQGRYFVDFVCSVPNEYPSKHIVLDVKGSNLPNDLMQVILGHAAELCRQCVQPPLRRKPSDPPFEPKPSLKLIARYLVAESVRTYPLEKCPLCGETALPENPEHVVRVESDPKFVFRVYCGHMYHKSCLEAYTKTPPFAGGKKCPTCNQRIFHDKWNVQPRLAEERWAHQEARKREVAEVADFLGF